jgi:hypothetical protein
MGGRRHVTGALTSERQDADNHYEAGAGIIAGIILLALTDLSGTDPG